MGCLQYLQLTYKRYVLSRLPYAGVCLPQVTFCLWGFQPPASHVAMVSLFLQCFALGFFHHLPIMLQQFHSFYSIFPLGFSSTTVSQFLQCFAFGVFQHNSERVFTVFCLWGFPAQQFHSFYSVLPLGFSSTTVSVFTVFCLWVFSTTGQSCCKFHSF